MAKRDDQTDLCINCLNIDSCSYYRNKKKPIIFCEEFVCDEPNVPPGYFDSHDYTDIEHIDAEKQSLCVNCKQMDSCKWNKNKIKFYCEEHE